MRRYALGTYIYSRVFHFEKLTHAGKRSRVSLGTWRGAGGISSLVPRRPRGADVSEIRQAAEVNIHLCESLRV